MYGSIDIDIDIDTRLSHMITNTNLSLGMQAVEEMHEKFSYKKSNKNRLEMEVKDAEKRLAAAKKAYNRQEMLFLVTDDICVLVVIIGVVMLILVVFILSEPHLSIHIQRVTGPELVVEVVIKVFIVVVVVIVLL